MCDDDGVTISGVWPGGERATLKDQIMACQHIRAVCAGLGAILSLGLVLLAPEIAVAKTAEPAFAVTLQDGDIEIRRYDAMVIAEVEETGARDAAISTGFRTLAAYIFGANTSNSAIAMTSPVSQRPAEKIAMTAPVTQQPTDVDARVSGDGPWKVRFVMPAGSTLQNLPTPNDTRIKLIEVPAHDVAAIRFSGWSSDSNLSTHRDKLLRYVEEKKLPVVSPPIYAFYDPPWTLPFWRRNEVMIDLAPGSAGQ